MWTFRHVQWRADTRKTSWQNVDTGKSRSTRRATRHRLSSVHSLLRRETNNGYRVQDARETGAPTWIGDLDARLRGGGMGQ
jgi:hypothetical protein